MNQQLAPFGVELGGTAKTRLLASLRLAIRGSVTDVTLKLATELLEELAQAHAEKAEDGDPPTLDPHAGREVPMLCMVPCSNEPGKL